MSYINSLKNLRKEILKKAGVEAPEPVAPTRGLMGGSQRAQPIQQTTLKYDPKDFILKAMEGIQQSRIRFDEKMAKSIQTTQDKAIQTRAEATSKLAETFKPAVEEAQPTREIIDSVKDRDLEAVPQKEGSADIKTNTPFIARVKEMAGKYGTTPQALLAVMHFETGGSFSSDTRNAAGSGATGLIQFMPSTAKGLGTTTEKLASLSPVEQLEWVDKYLENTPLAKGGENTVEDVYMSVLYPKAVGKGSDYVLFEKGTKAYDQNRGLDHTGKGFITKADAAYKVKSFLGAYSDV